MSQRSRNPIRFVLGAARRVVEFVLPWDVAGNGQRPSEPIPSTAPPRLQEAGRRVHDVASAAASGVSEVASHTAGVVTGTLTAVRDHTVGRAASGRTDAPDRADPDPDAGAAPGAGIPYEEWTKADLYERAQELDVPGRSKMSKSELIEALRSR